MIFKPLVDPAGVFGFVALVDGDDHVTDIQFGVLQLDLAFLVLLEHCHDELVNGIDLRFSYYLRAGHDGLLLVDELHHIRVSTNGSRGQHPLFQLALLISSTFVG